MSGSWAGWGAHGGAPLLTYSRPKGEYTGAGAESIMVDFYLTNATLGPND